MYGDAEAVVVDILTAAVGDQARVSTDLIGYADGQAWIVVARAGGIPTPWLNVDNPEIRIDTHAADKGEAFDLAAAAAAAVYATRGLYTGRGLTVVDVGDSDGIAWSPDDTHQIRYRLTMTVVTRPTP